VQVFGPPHRDVALASSPTFEESVQALLNALNIGTMGQLLGTLGTGQEVAAFLDALGLFGLLG
jgi:hypothetical protein